MKENNIFDRLENDFDCIADETIITDTGINTENVRRMVMEEINGKKKKRFSKKIVITLIAAALSVGILTTGAVASGSFNSTFAEWFSGDCELGLYSGGNIYTKSSSDDFDINVLGVAGDDDEACIAFDIIRKDGKDFYAGGKKQLSFENYNIEVSLPWFTSDPGGSKGYDCFLKDSKTIQVNVCIDRKGTLKGQRFTGNFSTLKLQEYECIKKCEEHDIDECDKEIARLSEEYKDKLTDGAYIFPIYIEEKGDSYYCIINDIKENVSFDVALNLNYKSTTRECRADSKTIKTNSGDYTLTSVTVSPLSVRIVSDCTIPDDAKYEHKVYMKNGEVYNLYINGIGHERAGYEAGYGEEITTFEETTMRGEFKKGRVRTIINPDDIEKIDIGGAIFTVK